MKGQEILFSSKSDEYETPTKLFNELNEQYHFVWDLACSEENKKCLLGYTKEEDSLHMNWYIIDGFLWLNPPYSQCKEFVKKAYEEMQLGAKIIMLLPSRTDTRYFHDYIYNKDGVEITFIKGRLKFNHLKSAAPFPSMVVKFENK